MTLALLLGAAGCDISSGPIPEAGPESILLTRTPSAQRATARLLTGLEDAWSADRRGDLRSLAAPGRPSALAELRTVRANVRTLAITGLSLDLRDIDPAPTGTGTSVAQVGLRWRTDGRPHRAEVALRTAATATGAGLVSVAPRTGAPTPLFLLDALRRVTAGRATVVLSGQGHQRYARLARRAIRQVSRALPGWRGRLLVEVPSSGARLEQALGAEPGSYAGTAAVTTRPGTGPARVVVNRSVLDRLGDRGAQAVLTHEAVHIATDAVGTGAPAWLVEGYADHVALREVPVPVTVLAAEGLARVARTGPPAQLPGPARLMVGAPRAGAAYELSWLACRQIARDHGERRLARFYVQAGRDGSLGRAFRVVLGTTEAAFTARWRSRLTTLAGRLTGSVDRPG